MRIDYKALTEQRAVALPIDYSMMVASLLGMQAGSAAAIAQTHYEVIRNIESNHERAMVTLLQGRPGWQAAATSLGGSFHSRVANQISVNLL